MTLSPHLCVRRKLVALLWIAAISSCESLAAVKIRPLNDTELPAPDLSAERAGLLTIARSNATQLDANASNPVDSLRLVRGELSESQVPELELPARPGNSNKVMLALVEMAGLGLCGVDRCVAGQTCLGIVKGLTVGGVLVWFLIDMTVIAVNCVGQYPSINQIGFEARWDDRDLEPAKWIVISFLVLAVCGCCCQGSRSVHRRLGHVSWSKSTEPELESPKHSGRRPATQGLDGTPARFSRTTS
mmetsp:Transcript_25445/g.59246  ORF Transcript_25445/g.59246 Transcript_25445/m.59246 type:complete len:245 (+) Transcript_25445:107-841(+)